MANSSADRNPVEVLAEEFLERDRRGERPTLSEYVARHPELADAIRELFPVLLDIEDVRPDPAEATGSFAVPGADGGEPLPERIGDYRILRVIGQGGMGTVYEAEQESLGRHVAVKVLPRSLHNPKHLRRFEREARAAGRLHHTNIVPVFGVGHEGDLHYYVMQFIQGQPLDEVMAELRRLRDGCGVGAPPAVPSARERTPTAANVARSLWTGDFAVEPGPSSAQLGSDSSLPSTEPAASSDRSGASAPESPSAALAPARDEGPAGASGPPVPTDARIARRSSPGSTLPSSSSHLARSGGGSSHPDRRYARSVARLGVQAAEALAYAADQGVIHRDIKPANLLLDAHGSVWVTDFGLARATGEADLTRTGDLIGTLRYMAPERFRGVSDHRADVYALGLTLYELLALRPAFDEQDRALLIRQIAQSEPPRLERLDPTIPRNLATIVHKAIARDPADRYASADDLAADLQRYLEDRPIRARPLSAVGVAWRWCRRNPTVAGLLGLVAVLLAGIAGVATVGYFSTKAALVEVDRQRDEAIGQRNIAEDNLYFANIPLAQHAWDEANIRRMKELLVVFRPRADQVDRRGWEWYHLMSLTRQELLTLSDHSGSLGVVAWSPDGRRLATGGQDRTFRVWDAETGEEQTVFRGHDRNEIQPSSASFVQDRRPPSALAWSPDGRALASGHGGGEIKIWDAATGRELRTIVLPERCTVTTLDWSPDGTRIASTGDLHGTQTARIWDVSTGRALHARCMTRRQGFSASPGAQKAIASHRGRTTAAETRSRSGMPRRGGWSAAYVPVHSGHTPWLGAQTGGSWQHQAATTRSRSGIQARGISCMLLPCRRVM